MANDTVNFYYDPTRQGLDTTLWKILGGTPTYATGIISINAASMIGYADIFKGDISVGLTIPAAPTAGDIRKWGLIQVGNVSGITFDITDNVFTCNVLNSNGTSETAVVVWQAAWTAHQVDWKIKWTGFSAEFFANGVSIAFLNGDTLTPRYVTKSVPSEPLSIFFRNDDADNMDLAYVEAMTVRGYV